MKLTVLKSNVKVNEVSVETNDPNERYEIYVGRSEDCHVRIDDPLISRHHFVIKLIDGKWKVEKLTQLGVVLINGQSDSVDLRDGDEIRCGYYSLFVSDLGAFSNAMPRNVQPEYSSKPAPDMDELFDANPVTKSAPAIKETPKALSTASPSKKEPAKAAEDDELSFNSSDVDKTGEIFLAENDPEMNLSNNLSDPEEESLDDLSLGDEPESSKPKEEKSNEPSGLTDFSNSASEEPVSDFGQATDVSSQVEEQLTSASDLADEGQEEATRVDRNFANYQLNLFGEHAPYDRFALDLAETFIGRDNKKCQIILNDPEVSTVHAVIRKTSSVITLEDLNSSNGTILNGERINRSNIGPGDEFVIGGTSFTLQIKSDLLSSEKSRLMPVERGQIIETEEIVEEMVDEDEANENFSNQGPEEKSIIKRIWNNPEKRKKAIYIVAGLAFAFAMLYEEDDTSTANQDNKAKVVKVQEKKVVQVKLTPEQEQQRNESYELGVSFFDQNKFFEALQEFQKVVALDPNYKKIQTYIEQTKTALKEIADLEAKNREEEERIKTKKFVAEILEKAKAAVKERQVTLAESYFSQITEKDPENLDVQQLKLELESWQKEEQRKTLEAAAKAATRKAMVDALSPGKTHYLKKEWYRAVLKLEEFLRRKGTDEDLLKEASDMLSDSKEQLASELGPMLGKARSFKEGQDLKSAYEAFLEVLKLEPSNTEALNEIDDIKSQLDSRSKKIYREGIIAESLSLFTDAKEKFQEVQQISPTDSDYYKKATEKLKNYLE